jgi:hypothetical protein
VERLISADSHVKTTHEEVKKHLAAKYHDEYDAAVAAQGQHEKELMAGARTTRLEFNHEAWSGSRTWIATELTLRCCTARSAPFGISTG